MKSILFNTAWENQRKRKPKEVAVYHLYICLRFYVSKILPHLSNSWIFWEDRWHQKEKNIIPSLKHKALICLSFSYLCKITWSNTDGKDILQSLFFPHEELKSHLNSHHAIWDHSKHISFWSLFNPCFSLHGHIFFMSLYTHTFS